MNVCSCYFAKQLLYRNMQSTPVDFFPIVIQFIIAVGFVGGTMIVTHLLGRGIRTKKKLRTFESGIDSVGNARQPFAVKYFLTAILFVLFDVEVIFLYPWAVNFLELGMRGVVTMLCFMTLLLAGFVYIIRKGALEWDED